MSENSNKKSDRNDEIDLLDLFRRIGKGFANMFEWIGRAIIISIVFMLKRWIWLTISVLLGVGVSYLLKYTVKSFYSSEMVISCNAIPVNDVIEYINKLHTFCEENNKQAVADAVGLNETQVSAIKDIQAFWIIDKGSDGTPDYVDYKGTHSVYDTINVRMNWRLAVRVITTSPQEFSKIRDGIINYISNNDLFIGLNDLRLIQDDEMLARINYDIGQLDSLQKVKYFEETRNKIPEKGGQMIFLQEQKTQLLYEDIYSLYEQKQYFDKQKEIYSNVVTLLSDFTIPLRPENTGSYYGKVIIPVAFCLCLIILIISNNRKKLMEIYHKY